MHGEQRYVSDELTHFVGRGLNNESEQYGLLITILKSGELRPSRGDASDESRIQWLPGTKVSDNKTIAAAAVCFCDIPADDLGFHMGKYSRFGLAFRKSFLVTKGANPVFYIARDSMTRFRTTAESPPVEIPRGDYYDLSLDQFLWLMQYRRDDRDTERPRRLLNFLIFQVFGFLKFFDAASPDTDPQNFYMEREWRVLGRVAFGLDDVWRIVLPADYSEKLRLDLPNYRGQVTFTKGS